MKKTDVKQSLEKQVELHVDEKPETVTLEMTPEQRDRVVALLGDEKIKEKAEKETTYFEFPFLAYSHNINGKRFGPGKKIVVPDYWVGKVIAGEQSQRDHEMGLNTSQKRMYEVLQSGQAIPLKVSR